MLVYISAPIDLTQEQVPWDKIAAIVEDAGHASFIPLKAYGSALQSPAEVFDMCLKAVEVADLVLAWYPPESITMGVPIELYHATMHKKPILVIGRTRDDIKRSCALSWIDRYGIILPVEFSEKEFSHKVSLLDSIKGHDG